MGGLGGAVCFRPGEVRRGRAERVVCASAGYGPVARARLPALAPQSQAATWSHADRALAAGRGPPPCRQSRYSTAPCGAARRARRCGTALAAAVDSAESFIQSPRRNDNIFTLRR
jgi:hypothetical protein